MKLFDRNPFRIGSPSQLNAGEGIETQLADGSPKNLREDLAALIGEQNVFSRVSDLVRYASDASPYRLIPQIVVTPTSAEQVASLLRYCAAHDRHACFRAAGTSLNGQSQSDDVLIDVRRHFGGIEVIDDAKYVRVRPGAIVAHVNAVLARYGRQLGPDPASGRASTMGALIANNAAGMRCTPERSAYATVKELTFVLPSGVIINTADTDAEHQFAQAEPQITAGLIEIRDEILANPSMVAKIRKKYSIRNTIGYTMRSFLDADTPLQIFKKLLVGSEGTLGFIAQATLETFKIPKVMGLWWVHTQSISDAVSLVPSLKALDPTAVEMLPGSNLVNATGRIPGTPEAWKTLPKDGSNLLLEFGADTLEQLTEIDNKIRELIGDMALMAPLTMNTDREFSAMSWRVRSELNSDLARNRPAGAANVNEDVCFPLENLAEGVQELIDLLRRYRYPDSVAGHGAYGNMHFTLTPKLGDENERIKYGQFMDELAAMVVDKYHGSLKAEHGTGINMAPFVEREWGSEIYSLMWKLRRLVDPHLTLGPDVVLTNNENIHLTRFKTDPLADPIIDTCIECGFCETVCPSRNVSATPRQRIVLRREMARQPANSPVLKALIKQYQYDAIDSCAADSSCALACPYDIDTGALMKSFRAKQTSTAMDMSWLAIAKSWKQVESLARALMNLLGVIQRTIGWRPLQALTKIARVIISEDLMPSVPGVMPRAAEKQLPVTNAQTAAAVYFPACINRIFGRDPQASENLSLSQALVRISQRAGTRLWIPKDVAGHCCGTIWSSKGYKRGRDYMYHKVAASILNWTNDGELPLVVDASSCSYGLINEVGKYLDPALAVRYAKVQIIDSVAWCQQLLEDLEISQVLQIAAVHPGCSVAKLGLEQDFLKIAEQIAENVHQPLGSNCCGTAGDRGLLHPELVISATKDELSDLPDDADAYLSSNRTCEMGLRHATNKPYESIIFALEKASR